MAQGKLLSEGSGEEATASASKVPEKAQLGLYSESSESDLEPRPQKKGKWTQSSRKCFRCAATLVDGHNQSCPLKLCCGKCGRSGHESSVCWRPKQHSLVYDSQACLTCKRYGHRAQDCLGLNKPLEVDTATLRLVSCLRCGVKGHLNCGRAVVTPPVQPQSVDTDSDEEDLWGGKHVRSKPNH